MVGRAWTPRTRDGANVLVMDAAGFPQLVRELMTVGVFTCTPDTLIVDIAKILLDKNLEALVVMEEGNAIGVVGQDELVKALSNPDWKTLTAEAVMQEEIVQLPADLSLDIASQMMHDKKVRAIFLMHNAGGVIYPAGTLTYRHLLRLQAAKEVQELKDMGFNAERQSPLESFIQRRDAARSKFTQRR
jgi:CBS domain-containing protein